MNFADLKKNSGKQLETLVTALNNMKTTNKYIDDRFWTVGVDDKTGNGTALLRFLAVRTGGPIPWQKVYSHAFQGPGGWYIENSRTTINEPDPVSEANSELWATGQEANKDLVRKRKRKTQYITNVIVLSDPKNPENNGKVFLYKFGQKIFEKIQMAIYPEFEDQKSIDPFDFWAGANFRLRVKRVAGYPNYDDSGFEGASGLFDGDDKKIEQVWNNLYDLTEFINPLSKHFKSYEELSARFNRVIGMTQKAGGAAGKTKETAAQSRSMPTRGPEMAAPTPPVPVSSSAVPWGDAGETDEDDDESVNFFKKLEKLTEED